MWRDVSTCANYANVNADVVRLSIMMTMLRRVSCERLSCRRYLHYSHRLARRQQHRLRLTTNLLNSTFERYRWTGGNATFAKCRVGSLHSALLWLIIISTTATIRRCRSCRCYVILVLIWETNLLRVKISKSISLFAYVEFVSCDVSIDVLMTMSCRYVCDATCLDYHCDSTSPLSLFLLTKSELFLSEDERNEK